MYSIAGVYLFQDGDVLCSDCFRKEFFDPYLLEQGMEIDEDVLLDPHSSKSEKLKMWELIELRNKVGEEEYDNYSSSETFGLDYGDGDPCNICTNCGCGIGFDVEDTYYDPDGYYWDRKDLVKNVVDYWLQTGRNGFIRRSPGWHWENDEIQRKNTPEEDLQDILDNNNSGIKPELKKMVLEGKIEASELAYAAENSTYEVILPGGIVQTVSILDNGKVRSEINLLYPKKIDWYKRLTGVYPYIPGLSIFTAHIDMHTALGIPSSLYYNLVHVDKIVSSDKLLHSATIF